MFSITFHENCRWRSVDFRIVVALRAADFDVWAVVTENPGINDIEVLNIAFEQNALLLTEDKDFGELVIRLRLPHHGIFLIRLGGFEALEKIALVVQAIQENRAGLADAFAVLDWRRLRIRHAK